jgi:cytochrome P450
VLYVHVSGHPEVFGLRYAGQHRLWCNDFARCASAITSMCRTLVTGAKVRGTTMAAGDEVKSWHTSANRDEFVFANPRIFRPDARSYGAGGAELCFGANLARREIVAVFRELRRKLTDAVASEDPPLAVGIPERGQTAARAVDPTASPS